MRYFTFLPLVFRFPALTMWKLKFMTSPESVHNKELTIELGGEFEVFNAISPNHDGQNDFLYIQYIELFPDTEKNSVTLYNRWGDVVWEGIDYDNSLVVFNGTSTDGKELPSGTCFYKIEFTSGRSVKTGYLSLNK
jgi:gliding motility-associated-like protein